MFIKANLKLGPALLPFVQHFRVHFASWHNLYLLLLHASPSLAHTTTQCERELGKHGPTSKQQQRFEDVQQL